jgi:hypothetical protein
LFPRLTRPLVDAGTASTVSAGGITVVVGGGVVVVVIAFSPQVFGRNSRNWMNENTAIARNSK